MAQSAPVASQAPVDAASRAQLIDTLIRELNANYVFPETAKKESGPAGRDRIAGAKLRFTTPLLHPQG